MTTIEKERIAQEAKSAVEELCTVGGLRAGQILVVGCSTSEVCGAKIGTDSAPDVAKVVLDAILSVLSARGIFLAAQCCEHLNRALIVERRAFPFADEVNVVPAPKAGGSFATAAYAAFEDPIAVEFISADAGLDIGGTLIGMHLKRVAVPVRLAVKSIGCAPIIAARVRPKFIGGARAQYNEKLL
ncbi:MAG: TIGR01440 family protein [Clostridia bacterium]|nr:TIGR01440 family protein [Clostridia bacterium]